MSTDKLGKELVVGQRVLFVEPYYHYLEFGEVIKVTPKGATVFFTSHVYGVSKTNRVSNQIVVVEVPA